MEKDSKKGVRGTNIRPRPSNICAVLHKDIELLFYKHICALPRSFKLIELPSSTSKKEDNRIPNVK